MIICDIRIDVNICEPHYVNLFFLWTSSIVQMLVFITFDIFLTTWHLLTFLSLAYVVWGKVIISHLSVCLHRRSSWGYLSQLEGGTYLGQGGTLLGWRYLTLLGVPTLSRGLPTFMRGYLPWLERYLPWPGGTYPGLGRGIYTGHGGTFLGGGSTYPDWGYLPQLGWIPLLE